LTLEFAATVAELRGDGGHPADPEGAAPQPLQALPLPGRLLQHPPLYRPAGELRTHLHLRSGMHYEEDME